MKIRRRKKNLLPGEALFDSTPISYTANVTAV